MSVFLPIAIAQPVQVNATGTINNQARYVIGSEANGIAVEFLPATQTVDPSSTAFSIFNLLQVRVTVTGNPFVNPLNIAVRYSVVVGGQGSSGGTLKGSLRTNFVSGRPTLVLAPDGTDTVIVDGVTISWSPPPSEMQQIWDSAFPAPPPTPMPVNARATRGRIILNPSSLQLTVPGGRTLTRDISVDIPPGTQLLGSSGLFVSAWSPTPGTVRISAFHPLETPTVSSSLLRFTAPGLAPVYLPVELTLTPGSDYLKPAQQELDFIYTRGSAGPSSQVVPIQSSTPFTLMPYSWDATWIDVTASSSGLTVTPMMTNKPLGTHRTRVQLRNETGLVSDVY